MIFLNHQRIAMNIYLENFVHQTFKNPGKALDLGAGKFYDVTGLRQQGWKCHGVDRRTGVNLEHVYHSPKKPFDLIFSNYVLHKLRNPNPLLQTARHNLKSEGWLFIHTFDKSDQQSTSTFTKRSLKLMLKKIGFRKISTRTFKFYDNEPGHKHWHTILEATAQK